MFKEQEEVPCFYQKTPRRTSDHQAVLLAAHLDNYLNHLRAKGDSDVHIDGVAAKNLTLERVRDLFKVEGESFRLRIQRGTESLDAKITLRRLL